MGTHSAQQDQGSQAEAPLERLSSALEADMEAVNALILKHMDSPVEMIPKVATYLIAAGGKRIRPLLTLAGTQIYSGDMARAQSLAACVEFIHTATLLHDDVVDESVERRGRKTANLVFGNQASVLVGDFLFSRAFQLMTADGSLEILRILSGASAVIAQGEVMQLAATGNPDISLDNYLEIIKAKTAALFAAACEIAPVIAGAPSEQAGAMAEYGLNLGIAFQITDDALDYAADRERLGKKTGDDFREGKITAPVIFALQEADDEERAFWHKVLKEKIQTEEDLGTARTLFARHNALEKSLDLARAYSEKARLALAEAPDHDLRPLLDALVTFTVERRY
jgi:octaprenyl-diphosphate synthase